MAKSLQAGEIDMAVGLTEGWVAAICQAQAARKDAGFKLVGTYVESPLRWAISTGNKRDDLTSEEGLQHQKVGVSRIGSGSYVMSFLLAYNKGWLNPDSPYPPFPVEVLNTFASLRDGVNDGTADFFMWEYFTSKRYFDNGEIKHIGDLYSPWASWMIVASDHLLYPHGRHVGQKVLSDQLDDALVKINSGIQHFKDNQEEAVEYISTKLDYSEEDARDWLKTVEFPSDVKGVEIDSVTKTMFILGQAGVIHKQRHMDEIDSVAALLKGVDSRLSKNKQREILKEHLPSS
jgi:hypothetical protein